MIPSTTRDTTQSAAPAFSRKAPTAGWIHSPNRVSLVQSVTMVPRLDTAM